MMKMIQFSNLGVSFIGVELFRGFDLCVNAGERVALTGPSGCGKSTLLGCLLGFVWPDAGAVSVEGTVLSPGTVWAIRRRIAYVPQEADLGTGTVNGFLEQPFHYAANRDGRGNLERVTEWFDVLGLKPERRSQQVSDLSGGEKQRVALVGALLLGRPILVMDEVTSALDSESAGRVADLVSRQSGLTMIGVVHHDSRMPYATRSVEMPHDH
jgi:putative ABC transport system ATP-binding protein